MKVKVDKDKCISCGLCANMCPDIFIMDEDNKSEVTKQPSAKEESCAKEAIDSCPVEAISEEK
ncbi:ferredoxin [Patescibacteria group bacterium]|nr:ferredoxin [Patescibacteria group bacterium]